MPDERGRTEQELAAADRDAEHDDARPDGLQPANAVWHRRNRELGPRPGIEPRPRLDGRLWVGGDGSQSDIS